MAKGTGLRDGVPVEGIPPSPGPVPPNKGESVRLFVVSSVEREATDGCLTEACSFSGTVSPDRHRDNSVSYLYNVHTCTEVMQWLGKGRHTLVCGMVMIVTATSSYACLLALS